MKLGQNKTPVMWGIIAVLLLIVGYDAWACQDKENRDTVSKMVTKSSQKYLLIPFLFGLLMGHFFWSQHHSEDSDAFSK